MARKKSRDEREYDVLLANVREVLKTSHGRDVVWHILGLAGIYSDAFTGNSTTFYNEGKRAVGLQVMQLLDDADLTIYPRLLKEKRNIEVDNGTESDPTGTDTITDYGTDD